MCSLRTGVAEVAFTACYANIKRLSTRQWNPESKTRTCVAIGQSGSQIHGLVVNVQGIRPGPLDRFAHDVERVLTKYGGREGIGQRLQSFWELSGGLRVQRGVHESQLGHLLRIPRCMVLGRRRAAVKHAPEFEVSSRNMFGKTNGSWLWMAEAFIQTVH